MWSLGLLAACSRPFPCSSHEWLDSNGTCHPAPTADTGIAPGDDTVADDVDDTSADTATPSACAATCDCDAGQLCYEGTCAGAGPALEIYRSHVASVVGAMDPSTGQFASESAYPTEAMMSLATASWLLCNDDLAAAAEIRASFAQSWEVDDLIVWSGYPYITRDYNARHIYNLWATGHILGDDTLIAAADATASAMLALERVAYGDYTLFCVAYETASPHDCVSGFTWIDVNQNSELALAFALLYTDPDSAHYGDADALDVVLNEIAAATSLQDSTSGAIPIGEFTYSDDYDMLYGAYAAWSWTLTHAAMPELALDDELALAADWLGAVSGAVPSTHRTYPYAYDGVISLSEGAMRVPLLSLYGELDPEFLAYYWNTTVTENAETYSYWQPWWLAVRAGVPLEHILPKAG